MAALRVAIRQQTLESGILWRLTESDGRLVHAWLPDLEDDDYLPIDRGGFAEHCDAVAFALGIDWARAEAGILGDVTTGHHQDSCRCQPLRFQRV